MQTTQIYTEQDGFYFLWRHTCVLSMKLFSSHVATKRNLSFQLEKLLIQEKNVGKKIRKIIYFSWIVLIKNNKHMDICQFHLNSFEN